MSHLPSGSAEHRHFVRLALGLPAVVRYGENTDHVIVHDISLKGALLKLAHPLAPAPSLGSALHFDLFSDPERILLLSLDASVRHAADHWLGVSWPTIDLDNLTALRQLLVAHVTNESLIDRELSELFSAGPQNPLHA